MRTLRRLIIAGVAVFAVLQIVRPEIAVRPAAAELQTTPEVKNILDNSCYSCHSDQRRLSWFDQIVPVYWLARHDILAGRKYLNFSTLGSKPAAVQKASLYECVNMMKLGEMPLSDFVRFHPEARVTPDEIATLKTYLAPWAAVPSSMNNAQGAGRKTIATPTAPISLATVHPELNGFPFDPSFENWKLISTTDRGDNNTFRFILGNEVAVKAARTGDISPWPKGARFAKIAWQQESGPDGLIHPGQFIQVELMLKDEGAYKRTEGWGWGRWRGLDLTPYGMDSQFVSECTGCHRPMRGNDYVYTLPISTARVGGREVVNNTAAGLPASLPYQPLEWSAITMYVDPKSHTTATLYGNDSAISAVKDHGPVAVSAGPAYPTGAVLALVTWAQRDDPHWFGARIPGTPRLVEFVQIAAGGQPGSYRRFVGPALAEDRNAINVSGARMSLILGLRPVELP